jgi:hypothetical protein
MDMEDSIKDKITKLLALVSSMEQIRAIGQAGDINTVPKAGESDIDIFVLADTIPSYEHRKEIYNKNSSLYEECTMNVCEHGVWGTGDIFIINGVETMLMYFSTGETLSYVNEILEGKHLNSINGFYPIGRCATLKNITILYDELGILSDLQEKLRVYPEQLSKELVSFHIKRVKDEENFGRALLRKDVLFYHQVLEVSIDHYLQALYAVNKVFFPSRKRTKQYIDSFEIKPEHCYERLLDVIRFGSCADGIETSYQKWCGLVNDLKYVCDL